MEGLSDPVWEALIAQTKRMADAMRRYESAVLCRDFESAIDAFPLCADCHRGAINGLHGQKAMWRVMKMDELKALNTTIRRLNT